ncbi:MAG: hypothetical protein RQ736_01575 [Thiogranum sp.]|nr:hypothetical protein [Thiogranum sp.]
MTQSSINQSGQSPESAQLNFNPIHPSMELPPEQLIRLLGMETKKDRKDQPGNADPSTIASPGNSFAAEHDGASSAPGTRRAKGTVILLVIAVTAAVAALLFAFSTTRSDRHASPATAIVTSSTGGLHHTARQQAAIDAQLMNLQKAAQQRFERRTADAVETTASGRLPDTGK